MEEAVEALGTARAQAQDLHAQHAQLGRERGFQAKGVDLKIENGLGLCHTARDLRA